MKIFQRLHFPAVFTNASTLITLNICSFTSMLDHLIALRALTSLNSSYIFTISDIQLLKYSLEFTGSDSEYFVLALELLMVVIQSTPVYTSLLNDQFVHIARLSYKLSPATQRLFMTIIHDTLDADVCAAVFNVLGEVDPECMLSILVIASKSAELDCIKVIYNLITCMHNGVFIRHILGYLIENQCFRPFFDQHIELFEHVYYFQNLHEMPNYFKHLCCDSGASRFLKGEVYGGIALDACHIRILQNGDIDCQYIV